MEQSQKIAGALMIVGLVVMVAAALDPLEGSIAIVIALALVLAGSIKGHSRRRPLLVVAFALVFVGVAALWGISAVGGFGGTSGRSNWWGLLLLPYPIGWITGLVGAGLAVREHYRPNAA